MVLTADDSVGGFSFQFKAAPDHVCSPKEKDFQIPLRIRHSGLFITLGNDFPNLALPFYRVDIKLPDRLDSLGG
jgi:hypothetical protein